MVKINNTLGSEVNISYGIPHGTVIGPLLFSLYINDLLTIPFLVLRTIRLSFSVQQTGMLQVENQINILKDWFDHKSLIIHFEKSHFLPFASYENGLPNFNKLAINNHGNTMEVTREDYIKYLGVMIDPHLRWDKHINHVYKNKYLRSILNTTHLKTIYLL